MRKIKPERTQKKVQRLRNMEKRAKVLQKRMAELQERWQKTYNSIKDTPEFAKHCEERGVVGSYTFDDVLA